MLDKEVKDNIESIANDINEIKDHLDDIRDCLRELKEIVKLGLGVKY